MPSNESKLNAKNLMLLLTLHPESKKDVFIDMFDQIEKLMEENNRLKIESVINEEMATVRSIMALEQAQK